MEDHPNQRKGTDPNAENPEGAEQGRGEHADLTEGQRWALLHDILVGPEEARILELEQVPRAPKAKDVGAVLAEATERSAQDGPELAKALAPTIEKGLMTSARKNPDDLAEAIYPVLGPAIRRSIHATLAAAVQTLNVTLENSLSPKGLRWRLEAWRTGRPFAEVVLLHSLAYRVEQVYWIHKETSVLLCDVSGVQDSLRDPELVSGMLAAIQDFVQDSFEGADDGALEQIEVSGFRVLMAQGPKGVLAVLVRGMPPEELARDMQGVLEGLHRGFAEELQDFDGDVSCFERAIPALQGLLGEGAKESQSSKKGQWLLLVAGAVLLVYLGIDWATDRGLRGNRRGALAALAEAPGYTVQGEASDDPGEVWNVFRDPLADPWDRICDYSQEALDVRVQWTPFVSLDTEMVTRRVQAILQPPTSVEVRVEQGTLHLEGEASSAWVRSALAQGPGIPGVQLVSTSKLVDRDRRAIEQRARSLHGLTLPFGRGVSRLDWGRPVVQARLAALQALDERVAAYGGSLLRLHLRATVGRNDTYEGGLSKRRLLEVQKALGGLGLSATVVEALPPPDEEDARSPLAGVRIGVTTLLPNP